MTDTLRLDSIDDAVAAIGRGEAVVVVDDEDRENEGDLIFAAEHATPELVAFMVRYTSGYVCVALEEDAAARLDLPPMVAVNEDARSTAYTVTVDAATGTTGISARSRAETIRRLADPSSRAADFTRPGHVVPLRARPGGVLVRDGHTEASVDLARLAGCRPAGALCEIVSEDDPADMARGDELRRFADEHGLKMISIAQLIAYRRRTENIVERVVSTTLPTEYGPFTAYGYRSLVDGSEHIALVTGDISGGSDVLVRVHSECLTGDVFGSQRCDCGPQLHESMRIIQEAGRGVVVYLRGHEGRGIGLAAKLQAYRLQEEGLDTVDANIEQGLPADAREYSVAGHILADLGLASMEVLSNNPAKVEALSGYGPVVLGRTRVEIAPSHNNIKYLRTKRDRMGHDLPAVQRWDKAHGI
ncbi:3,4-dihydroxy 2-butanone 4-phosphate synthase / GTP cyclohydrolase II [Corynebacterium appendicis CIP 107643]|uniref:Riboflavin biosynthesis protein RibBA n=1 Tax=Corynebacterium appendicis CIP 107643 TaxID=1161099 RepID=A0A1N7JGV3_9CORY|nr:bifunctional 3,4-dihydroxy-2-butanone-4-phosphate synthase/GTP cyclohydrolase II [Corynebacterium appendicis]MCT1684282.1 bifunctional 3,4-dihydroxy-2-butanone-4-phosphate synthase/GTP cyclohydrolase II [Corynebacterium appendicis]MDK8625082.1 bifunctional 3,4-dihydroxy-2-butanone-4-phosphate synthase/GTP cyclohydrolase II [Corynebacterium appendicis]WJY61190.1 Riboflavin biosynthesis protein RibBA [Corynebacterium appendicis CIP 107643]SIS48481.1 3,4-dihydroxy 2-butanone 4-phosphate synthas